MTAHTDQRLQDSLRELAAMSGRRKAGLLGAGFLYVLIVASITIGQSQRFTDDPIIDMDKPPVERLTSRPVPWQPHP